MTKYNLSDIANMISVVNFCREETKYIANITPKKGYVAGLFKIKLKYEKELKEIFSQITEEE